MSSLPGGIDGRAGHKRFTWSGIIPMVESVSVAEGFVEIKNKLGLHLRAASTLAQTVARFSSTVALARGAERVNASSVTGLMMLGAGIGTRLKVRAEGPDAEQALQAVQALFEDKFGEE